MVVQVFKSNGDINPMYEIDLNDIAGMAFVTFDPASDVTVAFRRCSWFGTQSRETHQEGNQGIDTCFMCGWVALNTLR